MKFKGIKFISIFLGIPLSLALILFSPGIPAEEAQDEERIPLVCYFGAWSLYRAGIGNFTVDNMDPELCTHIIYSFVGLKSNYEILCSDPWLDLSVIDGNDPCKPDPSFSNYYGSLRRLTSLKERNPKLKIILAIGGWDKLMTKRFSLMARESFSRNRFIHSIVNFLNRFNFDGVDIDWEFPMDSCQDLPGDCETEPNKDDVNMGILLRELKAQLGSKILSVAISATVLYQWGSIDFRYNISEISNTVDQIYIMAYDYYMFGEWDTRIMHHSPLFSANDQEESVNRTVSYLLGEGVEPKKLILGIGTYGKSYTMASDNHLIGLGQAVGPGRAYDYTAQEGTMAYFEIANEFKNDLQKVWTRRFDTVRKATYAYNLQDRTWVGYDDEWSIIDKLEYAIGQQGLGGIMIWSLEQDDFHNLSGSWYDFPLIGFIKERLSYFQKK